MTFPGSIKVKVTQQGQAPYYASALMVRSTPAATIEFLQRTADKKAILAKYELATDEEYWAYRGRNKV